VEGDETRSPGDRVQHGGDVGVTHDRFGPPRERVEIELIENARSSVPAANAPDGGNLGIAQRGVKVGEPLLVRPREVAVVLRGVAAQHGLVTQRTAQRLGAC
jgi:hypothetical protein